ncbi:MAG: hypothetical protein OEN01_08435, partial [Candidatus Krumholzibacteria bacterium]|nr:hypothetical protein [Candidatus Krumholzibacteria bacterium]
MRKFLPCVLVSFWILLSPIASQGATTLYLRDDGTFDWQDPIDTLQIDLPTATVLVDYDVTGAPGIRIQKFLDFGNPRKFHVWSWENTGPDIDMSGEVFVNFFTRTVGGDVGEKGAVMVALEADSSGVPRPLGSPVLVFEDPWPGTWQMRTAEVTIASHTLRSGDTLRLIMWVDAASGASIHFAYDTVQQPSHLVFGDPRVLALEGDPTDIPPVVLPGTLSVESLNIQAEANPPPVVLDSLEIVRIGSATDTDIDSVRLWRDNPVSDDADFVPSDDILLATTTYAGGVAQFANLNHSINQQVLFISNDVSPSAQAGRTFGVIIQDPSRVWSSAEVVVSDGAGWPQPDTTAVTTIVSPADTFSIVGVSTPYEFVMLGQNQLDVSVVVFNAGPDDLLINSGGLIFTLNTPNDRAGDYAVTPVLGNADTLPASTARTLKYWVDVLDTAPIDSTIIIDTWYDVRNLPGTWTATRTGALTTDKWTVIDTTSAIALIDSSATLYPASTFAGEPSLTLHVGINNQSPTGVLLSTTSAIEFSDGVQTYRTLLANPTYIPGGARNFTITFSPGAVPASMVAPASHDLRITPMGIDDFGTTYNDTIVTTSRNSIFVDAPQIRVSDNDLDVETVLPGDGNRAILSLNFENGYNSDQRLDTLIVTHMSIGPGTQTQLDAEIRNAHLVDDVDITGTLTAADTVVATTAFVSGAAVFAVAGRWQLPAMASRSLFVAVDVDSSLTRDGDVLDAALLSPVDVRFQAGSLVANDFSPLYPLDSFGRLIVNGMAAHQIELLSTRPDTLFSGNTDVPLMRLQVPQNGYEPDTLTSLSINNAAPDFAPSDIAALKLYRDSGDGVFDAGTDLFVGTLVFSGDRYQITGLQQAIDPLGTFFVAADIPLDPVSGHHFQPGLPVIGLEMSSDNDGPLDNAMWSPKVYVLRKIDKIDIMEVPLVEYIPGPGDVDVSMLLVQIDNNTEQTVRLETLTLDNASTGAGTVAELDDTFAEVRVHVDNGDGVVGVGDSLVRDGLVFSNGVLTVTGVDISFAVNQSKTLLVTADIDSVCARDGDSLRVAISSLAALQFDQPAVKSATLPIETSSGRVLDGMLAHQIAIYPTVDSLVINSGNDILVFDFGLPANGYDSDTLRSLEIQNLGSATSEHIVRLALYRDGGDGAFDTGSGDDTYVGDLIENTAKVGGRFYRIDNINLPLDQSCGAFSRFFVAVDIGADFDVGGSIQFAIPILGVDCASQNDGPIDVAAQNPSIQVIPKPDQLTIFPYSVGN